MDINGCIMLGHMYEIVYDRQLECLRSALNVGFVLIINDQLSYLRMSCCFYPW
jgi:hypothetical protein